MHGTRTRRRRRPARRRHSGPNCPFGASLMPSPAATLSPRCRARTQCSSAPAAAAAESRSAAGATAQARLGRCLRRHRSQLQHTCRYLGLPSPGAQIGLILLLVNYVHSYLLPPPCAGAMTVGDVLYCSEGGCTPCPVCRGSVREGSRARSPACLLCCAPGRPECTAVACTLHRTCCVC